MIAPTDPIPRIVTIVETSVYAPDLDAAEAFYSGILGLELVDRDPSRHRFFRVGSAQMLLVFNPETTMKVGEFPLHGSTGPGHVALGIAPESLDDWRNRLVSKRIPIEKELIWPRGGKSLYFRDPAGNSIELITPGVWGTPAGW